MMTRAVFCLQRGREWAGPASSNRALRRLDKILSQLLDQGGHSNKEKKISPPLLYSLYPNRIECQIQGFLALTSAYYMRPGYWILTILLLMLYLGHL